LFLQGPYGPFFRELGRALEDIGHRVNRINFNAGDAFDWPGPYTISYKNTFRQWPCFLEDCLERLDVTDLVLFNDSRPIHRSALLTTNKRDIKRWVFEEGYLRPYWITLERDGVNANSSLPRNMEWYKEKSRNQSFPEEQKFYYISRLFRIYKLRYYALERIWRHKYPYYQYHREFGGWHELLSTITRMAKKPFEQRKSDIITSELLKSQRPFFLLCLQIDHDTQIKLHSGYSNMYDVMLEVCASFSTNAPKDTLLVVKNHPLSSGTYNHKINARKAAEIFGISDRTIYIEFGNLSDLLRAAKGVIVVNSTVGPSAFFHNCPVITLGNAMYDMEGLTNQQACGAKGHMNRIFVCSF